MNEVKIETGAWSGNVKPWKATAYVNGKRVGVTGFCKTESAARRAGERIAERAIAKIEIERNK